MFSNKSIIVRERLPEDAPDFANLTLLSEPELFPAMFGSGARNVLQNLFRQRRNLFSFERSYFIEGDSTKAGMILGREKKRREEWGTGLLMIKHMKLEFFARIPALLKTLSLVGRAGDKEYYISSIAVYPEFRGNKLGTTLLLKEEAKRCGALKSTLDVRVDNQDVIRLYNRLGYSVVGKPITVRNNRKEFASVKMCKKLYDNNVI